ncbi:MAG: aminodeoxychorismate/anthranilate synthase component II [Flavobacteriales bacterium]|nr:aminodeoxychorismate/anthranilate synthase component II [Flavobacteriales bacterium]
MNQHNHILLLDNFDSFTYNLVHYIESISDFTVDVFRNNEISIEKVNDYEIIILSPGPGLPKDAGITKQLIETYAPHKKILGVCLGMQAIGEVFGGKLKNLEKVYHGISTPIKVIDKDNLLFNNLTEQLNVGRYHSWVIDKNCFPADLSITSIDENNEPMSLKHNKFQVYGVQFHPESILTDQGKEILRNFLTS